MSLTRQSIQKTEGSVKKSVSSFVDGAEQVVTKTVKKELKKPLSISMTATDIKILDRQCKKYNLISLQNDDDFQLNRSELVKVMAHYFNSLDEAELVNIVNKIIR